ncbi:MAG: ferrous iron transport protein B, partial [Muribaculaceae bacterium]|nr:ferrous iron transport protein B [Muribaculaceae bacterium]
VLYVGEDDADLISKRLRTPSRLTGQPPFDEAKALAFLVFVLLYFPCIATLAAIARETESWKYALFSACYNTALAWLLSFIVYRIAILF